MSSVLKHSITPKELNALAEKNKRKIMKTLNTKGYVENLGVKELREIEEKCMQLSHDGMADSGDRIQAGAISMEFSDWVDNL